MIYGYGLRVSTGSASDLHVNIPGFGTVVSRCVITYSKEFTFMVVSSRFRPCAFPIMRKSIPDYMDDGNLPPNP